MAKVKYLMQEDEVKNFVASKKEIVSTRNSMKANEVKEAKADILRECSIYDDSEGGGYEPADHYTVENGKAIIPVKGMLCPEVNVCSAFFGEEVTTYGFIQRAVAQADQDPTVKEIYLDIDSGGGYVNGVEEAGRAIKNAKKPTVTLAGDTMASAAYWLGSCADTVVSTQRTGFVGSIGVVVETIDRSKADEMEGYTRLVITNQQSKDKRPDLTTKAGKDVLTQELDDLYSEFKLSILEKRSKVLTSEAIDDMAGRVFIAEKAISLGLVDKLASRQDLINSSSSGRIEDVNKSACADTKIIGGKSMKLEDFLSSDEKAQADYNTALAEAKAEGKAEATADNEKYRANVLEIVELSGGTLNKTALASIKNGDTPEQFALAELKNHKASGQSNDAGVVEAKTKTVPEANSQSDDVNTAMDEFYAKRKEALLKQGRVK